MPGRRMPGRSPELSKGLLQTVPQSCEAVLTIRVGDQASVLPPSIAPPMPPTWSGNQQLYRLSGMQPIRAGNVRSVPFGHREGQVRDRPRGAPTGPDPLGSISWAESCDRRGLGLEAGQCGVTDDGVPWRAASNHPTPALERIAAPGVRATLHRHEGSPRGRSPEASHSSNQDSKSFLSWVCPWLNGNGMVARPQPRWLAAHFSTHG